MKDIHSHILFGVDDGCKTMEDSIRMIESAIKHGYTELVLTPHFSYLRKYTAGISKISKHFNLLKDKIKSLGLKIELYLGNEIDETKDIIELLKNGEAQTINNTKHVLIDFGVRDCDIDEYCYNLIVNGYIPIVAHPERYKYITDIKEYRKWKKTGALIQINASSLINPPNSKIKRMAKLAIRNKLVDFVATDAHINPKSFEYADKAYHKYLKKYNKEYLDKIFNSIIK